MTAKLTARDLPWVKQVEPRPCEGYVAKRVSLRRMYSDDPEKRAENARRTACKHQGRWRFTALKPTKREPWGATSGVYCWSHLIYQGVYGSMREQDRTLAWYEKHKGDGA